MKTEAWFEAEPFFAFCSGLWSLIKLVFFAAVGFTVAHYRHEIWAGIDSLASPVVSIYS